MQEAELSPGVTLLHVVAMTKAPGALTSPKDSPPDPGKISPLQNLQAQI